MVWVCCLGWTGLTVLFYITTHPENVMQQTALQGQVVAGLGIGLAGAVCLDRILAALSQLKASAPPASDD